MHEEKIVRKIDTTTTFSGLPAPAFWSAIERRDDGILWRRLTGEPIQVIESVKIHDGERWLHVSVSKAPKRKMPTYEDVQIARTLFVGDRECYQIFPTSDRYVNLAPVLHLWCNLDKPSGVLPRFEGVLADGRVAV